MKNKDFTFDNEELDVLENIDSAKSIMTDEDKKRYANMAKYTKSLKEKKQTTIRFSVSDLAVVKAKAKELGIGYQNLIQLLVKNYAKGDIKLDL